MEASPFVMPTVPPYQADLPRLAAMLCVFVLLNVLYVAACWTLFRGTPGQRMLSLQVGSAASGANLGFRRAVVRAVVAVGFPVAAFAAALYGVFAFETSVPWSDVTKPVPGGPADAWLSVWSGPLLLVFGVAAFWPVLLLVLTAINPIRQGPHDRLAGSLVVGKGKTVWTGTGYVPGYGPGYGRPGAGLGPGFGPGYGPPTGFTRPPAAPPYGAPLANDAMLPPSTSEGQGEPNDTDSSGTSGPPVPPNASPDAQPPREPPPDALDPSSWPGAWSNPSGVRSEHPPGDRQDPLWFMSDASEAPSTPHAATLGRRVGAYLFDCVTVYMLFSLVAAIVSAAFLPSGGSGVDERTYILLGLAGGVVQLVYFTSSWVVWQGTLGQRLFHMRLADATTGKSMGWMDAIVRWAIIQGPFALVTIVPEVARSFFLLVAMSWAIYLLYTTANNPDTRGLHDRFINTRVTLDL
jgi:uncharacterized RDD family membrane protein YckC